MDEVSLLRVWRILGIFTLVFSLALWVQIQGAQLPFKIDAILPHEGKAQSAVIGFPIVALALILTNLVASRWTVRYGGARWFLRVPKTPLTFSKPDSGEAKAVAGLTLLLIHIVPLAAIVRFTRYLLKDTFVCDKRNGGSVPFGGDGGLFHGAPLSEMGDAAFVIAARGDAVCAAKVEYFPVVEPIIYALLLIAAVATTVWFFWRVFRSPALSGNPRAEP